MKQILPAFLILLVSVLISGCAAKPPLLSRSGANLAGIDLSGHWVLRRAAGQPPAGAGKGEQTLRLPPVLSRRQQQRGQTVRVERSRESSVQVFIESGKAVKITQTPHSLFLSYDRARIEEYTFGENRIVALGPIEAQRVSGWEEGVYVVETLDEEGVKLTESWSLASDGSELVRVIGIVDGEKDIYASRQVFDRS